jgi:beta-lactamase regulating signal transducer with metallopeptidase domain
MIPTLASALVAVSRSFELAILVKATAILAFGLAAAQIVRRGRASIRHLTLAATFAAIIALPLVTVGGPAVAIRIPVERAAIDAHSPIASIAAVPATGTAVNSLSPRNANAALSVSTIFRGVWILSAASLLAALATGLWRLHRLRRQALPLPEIQRLANALAREAGLRRRVEVLEHARVPSPLTCGAWRPAILLPADVHDWTHASLRRALVHEIEHVRRGDWVLQIGVTAIAALYWFHPLVWFASRRLCLEAERACDDAVVRSGEGTDYADQLVLLARRMTPGHPAAIVGMAMRSDLSARVAALLDATQPRGRPGVPAAIAATLVAAAVVMAVAPIRAVAFNPSVASLRLRSGPAGEGGAQRRSGERRVRGLDRALYEASEDGDVAEIDDLLHQGANVNTAIDGDGSPLIVAARRARFDIARHLLDRGADPNMAVPGDGSPLIAAATVGALSVVSLLLDRGALIDQVVPGDENALIQASGSGHLEVVKLLIARGADVNARVWAQQGSRPGDGEWRTPLSMAKRGGRDAVIAYLRAAGARE